MSGSAVGYAFVLGMVALLNPCGFPLLPLYLTMFAGDRRAGRVARTAAGLRAGVALTGGFLAVFAVAGLIAGAVHAVILAVAPWLMLVIAGGILVFGLLAATGRTTRIPALPGFREGRGYLAMTGFGVAYAIGSLGCSLPVFVAAIGGALTTGSAPTVGAALVAYGLGMGLLATVLAVGASLLGATFARPLRRFAAALPRAAGVVCILVGGYLLVYWAGRLAGVAATGPVTAWMDGAQGVLTAAVEAAWLPVGGILVASVLAMLIVAAVHSRHEDVGAGDPRTGRGDG